MTSGSWPRPSGGRGSTSSNPDSTPPSCWTPRASTSACRPAGRVAELVGLSLGDLTLKWWFTADSDVVCGIAYSGYGWEKHTYFLDALTAREADAVAEVLLGEARARPAETVALVVDRTGWTAEFDWEAVAGGASAAVPRVPDILVLAGRTAEALSGLPAEAARSVFAPGLTLLSGR
ncbi:hypothetical protein GCM10009639_48680 [Kitasatospora putterlickiae]|uniref:Uncharacterized protein n=1 Tax=Kitasatospora putterlickiae TaxID=221725 RepID=A0ABN1YBZ6_9ACTN